MTDARTPDFAARCGKVTASRIADVIATTKSGPAASRANYMTEKLIERLTGATAESYVNAAMQWGTDNEPRARAVFEYLEGVNVEDCGFIQHPRLADSGASPDGLVGSNAILEIKCPNSATHWECIKAKVVPAKHKPQIQWQLSCTQRDICHFVSFDPRFPDELVYFHAEMKRDAQYCDMLENEVGKFLLDLFEQEQIARDMMNAKQMEKVA